MLNGELRFRQIVQPVIRDTGVIRTGTYLTAVPAQGVRRAMFIEAVLDQRSPPPGGQCLMSVQPLKTHMALLTEGGVGIALPSINMTFLTEGKGPAVDWLPMTNDNPSHISNHPLHTVELEHPLDARQPKPSGDLLAAPTGGCD